MKSADGLLGAINAIQADAGEHRFGNRAVDHGACVELFENFTAGIAKFEGVECGSLWRGLGNAGLSGITSVESGVGGRGVVGVNPGLVVFVKFIDSEGDDPVSLAEGDELPIVRDVRGLETLFSVGAAPFPGGKGSEGETEKGNDRDFTHIVL